MRLAAVMTLNVVSGSLPLPVPRAMIPDVVVPRAMIRPDRLPTTRPITKREAEGHPIPLLLGVFGTDPEAESLIVWR